MIRAMPSSPYMMFSAVFIMPAISLRMPSLSATLIAGFLPRASITACWALLEAPPSVLTRTSGRYWVSLCEARILLSRT